MTEAELSRSIIALAERLGWHVYSIRDSDRARLNSRSSVGFPDLLLAKPGRLIAAELKTAKGKPTREQRDWLAVLSTTTEAFVWRPSDLEDGTIARLLSQ